MKYIICEYYFDIQYSLDNPCCFNLYNSMIDSTTLKTNQANQSLYIKVKRLYSTNPKKSIVF